MTPLALVTKKNCCWATVGKAATISWNWLPGWQSTSPQVSVAETFVFETAQVCPEPEEAVQALKVAPPFCRTAVTEPPARMLVLSVTVHVLEPDGRLEQLTLATVWASVAGVPPVNGASANSRAKASTGMRIRDLMNMLFLLSFTFPCLDDGASEALHTLTAQA